MRIWPNTSVADTQRICSSRAMVCSVVLMSPLLVLFFLLALVSAQTPSLSLSLSTGSVTVTLASSTLVIPSGVFNVTHTITPSPSPSFSHTTSTSTSASASASPTPDPFVLVRPYFCPPFFLLSVPGNKSRPRLCRPWRNPHCHRPSFCLLGPQK